MGAMDVVIRGLLFLGGGDRKSQKSNLRWLTVCGVALECKQGRDATWYEGGNMDAEVQHLKAFLWNSPLLKVTQKISSLLLSR